MLFADAVNPSKCHIGVYSSETEAARAYDRALVNSLGIDAASLLNFQLVEYLDALGTLYMQSNTHAKQWCTKGSNSADAVLTKSYLIDSAEPGQVQEAIRRGLIPTVIPQSYSPSGPPTPIYQVDSPGRSTGSPQFEPDNQLARGDDAGHQVATGSSEEEEQSPVVATSVPRKSSNTPRSILDLSPDDSGAEVGDKRSQSEEDFVVATEVEPSRKKRKEEKQQQDE